MRDWLILIEGPTKKRLRSKSTMLRVDNILHLSDYVYRWREKAEESDPKKIRLIRHARNVMASQLRIKRDARWDEQRPKD